jgi:PKD repeat protein
MNKSMKNFIFMLLFAVAIDSDAQNLVNNPGFESYSAIPTGAGQYNLATGWDNCSGGGSPDYAHMLGSGLAALPNNYFATVSPHSGDAIMGFILWHYSGNFREYISTQLSSPLVPGLSYDVSFYITNGIFNGNYGGFSCDQVSVAFSVSPLFQPGSGVINVTPDYTYPGLLQDSLWHLVSFQFTPSQAFEYITIGSFVDDANTTLNQFGTSGFDAAYYFADDITVELANQVPVASFIAENHICPGTCTDFTNASQNATSYLWSFTGANPSSSTDVNPTGICYNTPGSYLVELIAINAASSDTLTLNNYITVYPYPAPQGIMQSGDTLFANAGATSYQWFYNGIIIPGATDYFYVATQSGDYNVVATDENDCEVEAVINNVFAGLSQPAVSNWQLAIFPNPVGDRLELKTENDSENIEVVIYNSSGQKVMKYLSLNISSGSLNIDVQLLSAGFYWIEVVSGNKIFRRKFMKN